MAEPFMSEIRLMSFDFPPKGWAQCDGQLLPINQNQGLFSLLGTAFGGDGRVNFALPDLRRRTPIHVSNDHTLGERGGEEAHTLNIGEMPTHAHAANGTSFAAVDSTPGGNLLANVSVTTLGTALYNGATGLTAMSPAAISVRGGSQAHTNMQPFLTLNFCIALLGIFPSAT